MAFRDHQCEAFQRVFSDLVEVASRVPVTEIRGPSAVTCTLPSRPLRFTCQVPSRGVDQDFDYPDHPLRDRHSGGPRPPPPAKTCRVERWRGGVVIGRSGCRVPRGFPFGGSCPSPWMSLAPFPAPARRTVRAVLPHTAHRRRSPPAFGFPRQSRLGLGATTIPLRSIRPSWFDDWKATTDQPNARDR